MFASAKNESVTYAVFQGLGSGPLDGELASLVRYMYVCTLSHAKVGNLRQGKRVDTHWVCKLTDESSTNLEKKELKHI